MSLTIRLIGDILLIVEIFEVLDCGNGNSDALCFVTLNHNSKVYEKYHNISVPFCWNNHRIDG